MINIEAHIYRAPTFQNMVSEAIAFFNETPVIRLPPDDKFNGAGVYAIYYRGDFQLYLPLSEKNKNTFRQPIYMGKAVPPGWRQGRRILATAPALYGRLKEHSESISQVKNLALSDFYCRFMILTGPESDLIVPVEAELIRRYRPLWNTVVDGFGDHDPGKGRYNQSKSEWDTLHPGRRWTSKLRGPEPNLAEIIKKVKEFFEG